jgi:hypothetical protein
MHHLDARYIPELNETYFILQVLHQWESEQGRLLKAISAYKQSE